MGSTAPAYTIGGITRPALNFDATGHIILDPAAAQFAAAYEIKALYMGLPASTPYPPVAPSLSTPSDIDAAANSIVEGAAANTSVHLKVSATNNGGSAVTYSLVGDTSGGGFKINPTTGVVSVANPAKIDFETSAGHAYSVTVQASDGVMTSSQTFKIGVTDVAPLVPTDSDATANSVAEGAAVNTHVGITAHATDINGPAVKYSLSADSSGGGFKIDAVTGVVSVADPSKIDYESAPGHAYSITTKASDGTLTNSQTFTIAVTDVSLPTPVDKDLAANTVAEGAAAGTTVGVTASAVDPNGPTTTYSLIGDTSGGGFTINAATGVVTVADASKIDYESAAGHAYSVTVKADDGLATTTQSFYRRRVGCRAIDAIGQRCSAQHGRRRCGERLDGRRHGPFGRRQRAGGDVRAGWRYLGRRFHHQCGDRRRHRRQFHQDRLRERAGSCLHRHRAGERRHAGEFTDLYHRRYRRRADGAGGQRYRSHRRGRRRRRQRLDGWRHGAFDRRQWGGSDVFAGRRHLGRRLHHQCRDRRRHRRRPHQDRLRECAGTRLYHHRAGQRRHADEFAGLHHRA